MFKQARERAKEQKDERHASKLAEQEARERAQEARRRRDDQPAERWEYQVKRIKKDLQTGMLGSSAMEQIFNKEGAKGWEIVAIEQERVVLKRRITDISEAELEELAAVEAE